LYITLNPWPAVNIALSLLLGRGSGAGRASTTRASWAVALLTFAAVAIRIEIAGLLGLFVIQLLLDGTLSITRLVKVGIISGLVSIGMRFDLRQFRLHSYTSVL
jgi:alpha-1,6-mannosyltransferase